MSNIQKTLTELIHYCTSCEECRDEDIADHLIANGVTIPVHCEECQHWDSAHCSEGQGWCPKVVGYRRGDWYCAGGEKKEE